MGGATLGQYDGSVLDPGLTSKLIDGLIVCIMHNVHNDCRLSDTCTLPIESCKPASERLQAAGYSTNFKKLIQAGMMHLADLTRAHPRTSRFKIYIQQLRPPYRSAL